MQFHLMQKYILYLLLFSLIQINTQTLEAFLMKLEQGYSKYDNAQQIILITLTITC